MQSAGALRIGEDSADAGSVAGTGEVTVSGGGSLTVSNAAGNGIIYVGYGPSAAVNILTVDTGGTVSTNTLSIGQNVGAVGAATVSGTGSTLTVANAAGSALLYVENLSTGNNTLDVDNGRSVSTQSLSIGRSAGSNGTVTVSGSGSSLQTTSTTDGAFRVGRDGSGQLVIKSGASATSASNVEIGLSAGANGAVTVTGSNSKLTAAQNVAVGGGASAAGGTGSLTAASGGLISAGGQVIVWNSGSILLDAGTIKATGGFVFYSGAEVSGSGVLDGNVTSTGTTYGPGSSPGQMEVTGNWTLASTDTLGSELSGSLSGEYNSFLTGGTLDLGGANLTLSFHNGFENSIQSTDTFTLIEAASLSGNLGNVLNGQRLFTADGFGSFLVNYGLGSALPDSVVISDFIAIPEPGTWVLLSGGLIFLLLTRKKGKFENFREAGKK